MIPEIDIWRAANLMLKRYGEKAFEESAARADELAADGDHDGASTWRRITAAVEQLANRRRPARFTEGINFFPEADRFGPATCPSFILDNRFYPPEIERFANVGNVRHPARE